jgi:hypothetical protein
MEVEMDKWRRLGSSAHGAMIPRSAARRSAAAHESPKPFILGTNLILSLQQTSTISLG